MSNKDPKIGEKKGFHLPHIFIILFGIVLVCAILTWIIPAGNFDRVDVDGREVVVPGTWHEVDASPVGFLDVLPVLLQRHGQRRRDRILRIHRLRVHRLHHQKRSL